MIITSLRVSNLRSVTGAEFRFRPGFNLLIGVNGVGKSTVLEAAAKCLAAVVKQGNGLAHGVRGFGVEDVRAGADVLTVECDVAIEGGESRYYMLLRRESGRFTSRKTGFAGPAPPPATGRESAGRPMAIWFDTRRAVPSARKPRSVVAAGGVESAFADALTSRELRLGELAEWMRGRAEVRSGRGVSGGALDAFESVVRRFLPGYRNVRIDSRGRELVIDDSRANSLRVRNMSDGERGTLAIVLDLTRRLFLANPDMRDPARDGEAVVLIDEIDLHLHPEWQRQVARRLTEAFPCCQFVATTHSPQVIGEIEHERIHIMTDEGVYSPSHSFGVESSRVLDEIMNVAARTETVERMLMQVADAVAGERFNMAREVRDALATVLGENDPEVVRVNTLIDFMEED